MAQRSYCGSSSQQNQLTLPANYPLLVRSFSHTGCICVPFPGFPTGVWENHPLGDHNSQF